jgi:hypothetical protein
VSDTAERRRNYALRRRIDKLLGRVHEARAEIVERGLDAVHEPAGNPGDADRGARRPPDTDTADASV